jgi:hypothetical protein
MVPSGAVGVDTPGGASAPTLNDIAALHGPVPALFLAWTHHFEVPSGSVVEGVTEHSDPLQTADVYQVLITLAPDGSLTHSKYSVALPITFQR